MRIKRRIVIHSTRRRLILKADPEEFESWCPGCARPMQMLTAAEAARVLRISQRAIFRALESGELHFTETTDGSILICLDWLSREGQAAMAQHLHASNE